MLWILSIACLIVAVFLFVRWLIKPVDMVEPVTATVNSGKYNWESPTFVASGPFFIKPWLQPGNTPTFDASGLESMELFFHTATRLSSCRVEVTLLSAGDEDNSLVTFRPESRIINLVGVANQIQYVTRMTGLAPDTEYRYRIFFGVDEVFTSTFATRKQKGKSFSAIVFGDMGSGSPWQRQVAYQMSQPGPRGNATAHKRPRGADLIISAGDNVYHHGRFNEYLSRFFPIYQAQTDSPETGAYLMDKTMMLSTVGNHDMAKYDPETLMSFDEYPDLMAFFALFSLPLNGFATAHRLGQNAYTAEPGQQVGANLPPMQGDTIARQALLNAAGERYPRMANFSYDYGLAHFLFLDANTAMDWTNAELRDFVRKDLNSVEKGIWKVVVLHQPPFTSNRKHQREQGMRMLADIFEECGVSVVFGGHCHCYERTQPIKFVPRDGIDNKSRLPGGYIPGSITVDPHFDGKVNKKPSGVIYIVTGGGGAKLDSVDLSDQKHKWQSFTAKLVGDRHSFTVVDFTPDTMSVRQIDMNGNEIDSIEIDA